MHHGDPVVTLFPNIPSASFAWLGCGWLRAIEVPINPDYRGDWLIHAIHNARARVIVTSRQYLKQLATVAPRDRPRQDRRNLRLATRRQGRVREVDPGRER